MKRINGTIITAAIAFLLSCESKNTAPSYPVTPYVEFRDLKFNAGSSTPDTLKLKLYLRDGDFDLGLDNNAYSPPYNSISVLNKFTGQMIPVVDGIPDHSNLALFRDRKTIDTLPPLGCTRWLINYTPGVSPQTVDTVYFQFNPNYENIFVDIFTKDNTHDWSYFDYTKIEAFPLCSVNLFDGRFPPLPFTVAGPFSYQSISAKEGVLTFSLTSSAFKLLFQNKLIKLRFSIQDRALNRSNVVETTEIQL